MEELNDIVLESKNENKLNPWFSIWLRPRDTIRYVLDNNMTKIIILLAALGGISEVLSNASQMNLGDKLDFIHVILICLIAGPIYGIIELYINAGLLKWTGGLLGGQGTFDEIKTASAWAKVPIIWALIIWIPEAIIFGKELFTSSVSGIEGNIVMIIVLVIFSIIELTLGIWAVVVYIKSIAEAQKFSAWRAISNIILSFIIVAFLLIGIIVLVSVGFSLFK